MWKIPIIRLIYKLRLKDIVIEISHYLGNCINTGRRKAGRDEEMTEGREKKIQEQKIEGFRKKKGWKEKER